MSAHSVPLPDVEDIQTTRTEKLLAVILTAFLLLGGIWTYTRIDDLVRDHIPIPTRTAAVDPAILRASTLDERAYQAQTAAGQALQDLELERYRTALDAGEAAPLLKRRYEAAEAAYAAAPKRAAAAKAAAAAARPAAEAAQRSASQKIDDAYHRQARESFLWRLGFVLLTIGVAYWLLWYMRRHSSR